MTENKKPEMADSLFDTQPRARWVPCGGLGASLLRLARIPLRPGLPFKEWWSKNESAAHFRRLYDSTIRKSHQIKRYAGRLPEFLNTFL